MMFGVPEAIANSGDLTVVRTNDVTDKCARIALHTAMTAPEVSELFLYGTCLNATSRVLDAIDRMCPLINIDTYKPTRLSLLERTVRPSRCVHALDLQHHAEATFQATSLLSTPDTLPKA